MNLQQTINELEQEAKKFQQAADALRAIQENGNAFNGGTPTRSTTAAKPGNVKSKAKPAQQGSSRPQQGSGKQKREVSAETRAKIAATLKARHSGKNGAA